MWYIFCGTTFMPKTVLPLQKQGNWNKSNERMREATSMKERTEITKTKVLVRTWKCQMTPEHLLNIARWLYSRIVHRINQFDVHAKVSKCALYCSFLYIYLGFWMNAAYAVPFFYRYIYPSSFYLLANDFVYTRTHMIMQWQRQRWTLTK